MPDPDVPVTPDNSQPPPDPTTADSMSGGVPDVGQPTLPDVSQTPAANVLAGRPSDMLNQAAAVHHSRMADSLTNIGKFLGGDTAYHITPHSDGSVSAVPVEMTAGQRWGRIAQAALMGAAKGFAVGQGPGGAQRAAAAGVETGMALPQAQQDQTLALAQKMNDQNQQRQLFNANMAYLNTRNLEASWTLGNNKKLAAEHDEASDLQFAKLKQDLHMIPVGPAADAEQAAITYNGNPRVQQALVGKGGQLVIHHPASGPPQAFIVPEDKLAELNSSTQTAHDWSVDPETLKVVKTDKDINPGTETGQQTVGRIALEQKAKLDAIKTANQALEQRASAAAKANAPPKEVGTWIVGQDPNTGEPIERNNKTGESRPMTQGFAPAGTFERRKAAQEKALGPARDSYNYASDYTTRGNYTGPGDEAMMDKFFDLARSSVGFRMTTPQQKMLLDSQSILNKAKASFAHNFTPNAPYFSTKQRQDIMDTMHNLAVSKGLAIEDGRASLPPLERIAPAAAAPAGGRGATDIPEPIAPARPGGRIASVIDGKPGSFDANGLWTSDDGTVTHQLPGRNTNLGGGRRLPMPKIGEIVNGREYLGGDVTQRSSWR